MTHNNNWADAPFALIPSPCPGRSAEKEHASIFMAHEMTHIHNIVLRALNAIYQQAPYVTQPKDIKDFLQLVKLWHGLILHHHDTEEEVFFPALEQLTGQKGIMDGNIEQHSQFEPGLEALERYATLSEPEKYDPDHLRAIIDAFAPVLRQHLADEIVTLKDLKDYPDAMLRKIWKKAGDYAQSSSPPADSVPFFIGCYDSTFEGKSVGFEFPFFIYYLNQWVFSRKYSGSWRFLPCDYRRQPRPLAFTAKA